MEQASDNVQLPADDTLHWPSYTWRPTIGFAVAFNVVLCPVLALVVFGAVICGNDRASDAIGHLPAVLGALCGINATVLPILGIASYFRGKMQADPNVAADPKG